MDCATSLSLIAVVVLTAGAVMIAGLAAASAWRSRFLFRKTSKIGGHDTGAVHFFGRLVAAEDAPMSLLSGRRAAYLSTEVRVGGTSVLRHVYGKKLTIADDTGTIGFSEQNVRMVGLPQARQMLAGAPAHAERELSSQFGLGPYPFPQNRRVRMTERGLWAGDNVSVFGRTQGGRFVSAPVVVTDVRAARARASRRSKRLIASLLVSAAAAVVLVAVHPPLRVELTKGDFTASLLDATQGAMQCHRDERPRRAKASGKQKDVRPTKTKGRAAKRKDDAVPAPIGRKKTGRAQSEAP